MWKGTETENVISWGWQIGLPLFPVIWCLFSFASTSERLGRGIICSLLWYGTLRCKELNDAWNDLSHCIMCHGITYRGILFSLTKKSKKKNNSLSTFLLLWRETFIVYIFLHNLLKFSHGSPSPTKKERDVLDGFPQQFIGQANSWHLVPAFSVRNKPNFHASYWK